MNKCEYCNKNPDNKILFLFEGKLVSFCDTCFKLYEAGIKAGMEFYKLNLLK